MLSPNGIAVGSTGDRVYVRVVGRGTFQNSQPLSEYATGMLDRGFSRFTVDVGECTAMDSTFLGVLAGIGLRVGKQPAAQAGDVSLVNVDDRQRDSLATLGLDRLFAIQPANGQTTIPGDVQLQVLPESEINPAASPRSKEATAQVMLEAHTNLIRADEHNKPKFADLTNQLKRRLEDSQPPPDTPEKKPR